MHATKGQMNYFLFIYLVNFMQVEEKNSEEKCKTIKMFVCTNVFILFLQFGDIFFYALVMQMRRLILYLLSALLSLLIFQFRIT